MPSINLDKNDLLVAWPQTPAAPAIPGFNPTLPQTAGFKYDNWFSITLAQSYESGVQTSYYIHIETDPAAPNSFVAKIARSHPSQGLKTATLGTYAYGQTIPVGHFGITASLILTIRARTVTLTLTAPPAAPLAYTITDSNGATLKSETIPKGETRTPAVATAAPLLTLTLTPPPSPPYSGIQYFKNGLYSPDPAFPDAITGDAFTLAAHIRRHLPLSPPLHAPDRTPLCSTPLTQLHLHFTYSDTAPPGYHIWLNISLDPAGQNRLPAQDLLIKGQYYLETRSIVGWTAADIIINLHPLLDAAEEPLDQSRSRLTFHINASLCNWGCAQDATTAPLTLHLSYRPGDPLTAALTRTLTRSPHKDPGNEAPFATATLIYNHSLGLIETLTLQGAP